MWILLITPVLYNIVIIFVLYKMGVMHKQTGRMTYGASCRKRNFVDQSYNFLQVYVYHITEEEPHSTQEVSLLTQ